MPSKPLKLPIHKSDRSLKRWYNRCNRLYFENSLPTKNVYLWWEHTPAAYANCVFEDKIWKIRVQPALYGWTSVARMAVIHEMAHIKLHPLDDHGDAFNAEMLRLAGLGAFIGIW